MLFKDFFRDRLTSKSFLLAFGVVTFLFVMDIAILAIFGGSYLLADYPIFSYGAILSLYIICILESLGFSIFLKTIRSLLKRKV